MNELSLKHSQALRQKYPECYPVILVGDEQLAKKKLLLNKNMTLSTLMSHIRHYNKLNKCEAYFLFTKSNTLLMQNALIQDLYSTYSSDDGFLYINVKKENTFG